jgi:hypothetical protein
MKTICFLFLLYTFIICTIYCIGFTEEISSYSINFPETIRNEKSDSLIERIKAFAEMLNCDDDYSALNSLWFNRRENIIFDGNFNISVIVQNYTNDPEIEMAQEIRDKRSKIKEVGVLLTHWAGSHPAAADYQDMGPDFHQNMILLGFFDNNKISSYDEFGAVINATAGVRFCFETGLPEMFQISFPSNEDKPNEQISWKASKYGDEIKSEHIVLLSKMNDLPRFIPQKNEMRSQRGNPPRLPRITNDKTLQKFFNHMLSVMTAQKRDDMVLLLDLPLIKPIKHRFGQVSFSNWKCQWGYFVGQSNNFSTETLQGYAYAKNSDGMPTLYLEGSINFPDKFHGIPSLNEKGIIVIFHSTGYPASYKTIVRNRLFGRQIEWNDKGEVISDVDLDIPKPWADAPNNVENSQPQN